MNGEMRENRVAGNVIQFGEDAAKAEIYDIYVSSLKNNKFDVPVKENVFWRRMKNFEGFAVDAGQKGAQRIRMVKVNTVEASRWIFEVTNNLKNIQWATMDTGAESDVFDPDNWEK